MSNKMKEKRFKARILTLTELSEITGVKLSYLSRVESGHIKSPGVKIANKIARALGCTTFDIWGD